MYSKEEKIKVYVMIGTIIMLLVIFSGITYAFFSATNNQGSTSLIEATSGKMLISYADGKSSLLVSKDIQPSNNIIVNKTFTLTGTNTTSGLTMPYKVGLSYASEFSDGQIHYYIKRTSANTNVTSSLVGTADQTIQGNTTETGYTTGTLKKGNRYLELATGEFKANTSNQTITFNLKIQFPDTGVSQDSEKGKKLTGEIVVNYEEETGVNYIARLYNEDKNSNGLLIDDTKDANIRYIGSDPNNYVEFGNAGELWRIVGIFNVTDSEGNTTRKLKLVRDSELGGYSWDTSDSSINGGNGVNDWTNADLMKELNGDYLDTTLTSNKNWYNGKNNQQTGVFKYQYTIKEKYQEMISESVWNIGGNKYNPSTHPQGLPTLEQYNAERGNITYQNSRPITWIGKIGIVYASDYGYASTDHECHENLRAGQVYSNGTYDYKNVNCKNNNWLANNKWYWTFSPYSDSSYLVFRVNADGSVTNNSTYLSHSVFPTVFLKSDIKIISGTGEKTKPYILG